MISIRSIAILLLISSIPFVSNSLAPTEKYSKHLQLDNGYDLFWKSDDQSITFELHYDSKWAIFGVADDTHANYITTWLAPDKTGHFSSSWANVSEFKGYLSTDTEWMPLLSDSQDNTTLIKFRRDIRLCNAKTNVNITKGSINVIFASGDEFVQENRISINQTQMKTVAVSLLDAKDSHEYACRVKQAEPVFTSVPTTNYENFIDLAPGVFRLYWNLTDTNASNSQNAQLIAEIHCKTDGWVGFGFSPNGGMDQSDVVIGWINNATVNFTDRFIQHRDVLIDQHQDWTLLKSKKSNGYTIFQFNRPVVLCNSQDRSIETGTPYVIYAYGDKLPGPNQDISYHRATRGSMVVPFYNTKFNDVKIEEENNNDDIETVSFALSNTILPGKDTVYYCKVFRIPSSLDNNKKHIIQYDVEFPELNSASFHHMLLYSCDYTDSDAPKTKTEGDCDQNYKLFDRCQTVTFGWAVGGARSRIYDPDLGYPLGGQDGEKYFKIELHYNNPFDPIGYITQVKMNLYLTSRLRENELGTLVLGTLPTYSLSVPPKETAFEITSYCFDSCMKSKLNSTNITLVYTAPHTHLTGVDVSTRLVRNGVDMGYVNHNKYFNFNYQNWLPFNPRFVLEKDDQLITKCVYKTTDRTNFTFGGEGTRNEMCYHYFTYYPRLPNFRFCWSWPSFKDHANLFKDLAKTGDAKLDNMNANTTDSEIIEQGYRTLNQASNNVREKFRDFYKKAKHTTLCDLDFNSDERDQIVFKNPVPDQLVCPIKT